MFEYKSLDWHMKHFHLNRWNTHHWEEGWCSVRRDTNVCRVSWSMTLPRVRLVRRCLDPAEAVTGGMLLFGRTTGESAQSVTEGSLPTISPMWRTGPGAQLALRSPGASEN